MSTDVNADISDANSEIGIQLTSLQYMDLENTILAATQTLRPRSYAIKLREHKHVEYGRFSLIETDYQRQNSRASEFDKLVQLPLFEAWPVFPDSLLSTEIAVSSPCISNGSGQSSENNSSAIDDPDSQCTSALYYKLHQPLPGYLGKQLYRSGTHIVALMSKKTEIVPSDSSLAQNVLSVLTRNHKKNNIASELLLSLFLEYDGSKGGRLKNRLTANIQSECYRLAHVCHRLNIIGKADMVLCDSSGVAVDAVRASVPAIFITTIPKGFERMHRCVLDFLTHGNRQKLIASQINALNQILSEKSKLCQVMSHQKSLHALVHRRIGEVDRLHARYNSKPQPEQSLLAPDALSRESTTLQEDLILHTQQTLCVEPDKIVKLKTSLESSRRKFQKFRESPMRFMEDSQSKVLRSLLPGRL